MRLPQIRTIYRCLWLTVFILLLSLSCNKDRDLLLETILENDTTTVDEQGGATTPTPDPKDEPLEVNEEESVEYESRTTVFPVIYDAYLENGEAFNQSINRLEEDKRSSYLMFNLSQIDSIAGKITSARLEFIIDADAGNGRIEVFKGSSNDWTESDITEKSAPKKGLELGATEQEYEVDEKVAIELNARHVLPEPLTLILNHKNGDDLAFASKEHKTKFGGKLVVVYDAPIGSEEIVVESLQEIDNTVVENPESEIPQDEDEEGNPADEEDNTEGQPTNEETEEDESPEEDPSEDETSEEEPSENEDVPDEEAPEEDNTEDDTTEEPPEEEQPTEEEASNIPPVAKANASKTSGVAPLKVDFTGSNSTDDTGVIQYSWDFKDGSTANNTDPSHTFNTPGTYEVTLTVTDEESLMDSDRVTITVNAPPNQAPIAVATANRLSGEAPLKVNFIGSNSSDDNGIVGYSWNFPNNSSSAANASYTFDNPGVYDITLTVSDQEGLTDSSTLTITVSAPIEDTTACVTDGGMAGDLGFKSWCWDDVTIPSYSGSKGVSFSQGQLRIDSECNEQQVTKAGDRLRFRVNPTNPNVGNWCSREYNMRAEIRTAPWDVRHSRGTEEWFGWSYTFGDDYVIDQKNQWKFFQVHNGVVGQSPQIGLEIIHGDQFNGHSAGEIYVTNGTTSQNYVPTGVIPRAGETLDIVVHTIWDNASNGELQVWINGNKVYDKKVSTIYASHPWGGNAKWGIYKWPWANASGVQESQQQGISQLETYMGALRMITRRPGDPDYGKNSYDQVAPR